jgi:hypothetical protein
MRNSLNCQPIPIVRLHFVLFTRITFRYYQLVLKHWYILYEYVRIYGILYAALYCIMQKNFQKLFLQIFFYFVKIFQNFFSFFVKKLAYRVHILFWIMIKMFIFLVFVFCWSSLPKTRVNRNEQDDTYNNYFHF